jgi:hypothetical protein
MRALRNGDLSRDALSGIVTMVGQHFPEKLNRYS